MTQCASCAGKSTLFICPRCIEELRAQLHSLAHGPEVNERPTAGLLDALADVALKLTCMGTGTGHRKKGDEMPGPFEPDAERLDKDGNPILTAQGRASRLLDQARNSLTTIVRDICESRGVDVMRAFRVVPGGLIGPLLPEWRRVSDWRPEVTELAIWLARNVHALACDESAGQWRAEVDMLVRAIERAVDRPIRRIWLGDCPTWHENTRQVCGVSLWAPEDAVETRCHRCRATHDPKRLKLLLFNDLERKKVPWEQILQANKSQPEDRQVPERTLQSWRRSGKDGAAPKLTIRGYLRPNGREVINRHGEDDVPLYLWPDVRRLRDAKPQKVPTGAAARRKVAT